MGRWHCHAIGLAGGRVSAVVDLDLSRAQRLARSVKARSNDQINQALAGVDVVHVCTPTASHAAIIEAALAYGCHVVVEKPLAATHAETARLYAQAAARGRILCPVHQFVLQRGVRIVCRDLEALGAIRHVEFTICSTGGRGRTDVEKSRIAWEIVPHPLSLIARLFGSSAALHWHTTSIPAAGELRVTGQVADASMAIAISLSGRPPLNELRIIGTAATAYVDLFHGYAAIDRARAGRIGKLAHPFARSIRVLSAASANLAGRIVRREPAYPGLNALVQELYAALQHGGPPPILPEEALSVASHLDQLRERAVPATPREPATVR